MVSDMQALMVTHAASWSVLQKKVLISLRLVDVFAVPRLWLV